jgi:hypothetical protein
MILNSMVSCGVFFFFRLVLTNFFRSLELCDGVKYVIKDSNLSLDEFDLSELGF